MTSLSPGYPLNCLSRPLAALLVVCLLAPWAPLWAQAGAAPAIKLTVREGDGALNNIRAPKAKEPVVVVTDAADRPVAGAQVHFLLPELGASAMFPASGTSMLVTTGPDGVAVGRNMRPNNVVGEFQIRVTASYQGQTARATITQTNAAQKSSGNAGKTALIVALLGGAGAAVAIGVTRGSKTQTPAGTSISAGGSTFGPPR
jgi:hypothetical protein